MNGSGDLRHRQLLLGDRGPAVSGALSRTTTTFHPLIDGWTAEQYTPFPGQHLRGNQRRRITYTFKMHRELTPLTPLRKGQYPTSEKRNKFRKWIPRIFSGTLKCSLRSSGLHSDRRRTELVARVGEPNDRSDFEAARVDRELGASRSGEGGLILLWNMGSRGDATLNDRGLWGSEQSETHRPRRSSASLTSIHHHCIGFFPTLPYRIRRGSRRTPIAMTTSSTNV